MGPREPPTLALDRHRGWKQTVLTVVATTVLGGLALLFTGSSTGDGDPVNLAPAPALDPPADPCPRSAEVAVTAEAPPAPSGEETDPCGGGFGLDPPVPSADLLQPTFH